MLRRYITNELNVSYRKIISIDQKQNYADAKLQRQYAASKYIEFLYKDYNLINVDESTLYSTDPRSKGWQVKGKHNQLIEKTKLEWVNIIAGISSKGNFFYCINRGKVNANIIKWYFLKLCTWLNSVDKQWRQNTIIILDNA